MFYLFQLALLNVQYVPHPSHVTVVSLGKPGTPWRRFVHVSVILIATLITGISSILFVALFSACISQCLSSKCSTDSGCSGCNTGYWLTEDRLECRCMYSGM